MNKTEKENKMITSEIIEITAENQSDILKACIDKIDECYRLLEITPITEFNKNPYERGNDGKIYDNIIFYKAKLVKDLDYD